MSYLPLLGEDLFVVQPALLADVTEGDGPQVGRGMAFGASLLLGPQALKRLEHQVGYVLQTAARYIEWKYGQYMCRN